MLRLIVTRVAVSLLTLWIVSVLVFGATELLPGDVAQAVLGQAATQDAVAGLRAALHLDQPGWLRYLIWLGGLLRGDPGRSLVNQLPVTQLIGSRLPNSLLLAALTAAFSVPLALTLGITAAVKRGSLYDRAANLVTVGVVSVPEFLVATLAVLLFAVKLHWLPALSSVRDIHSVEQLFRSFAMPVVSLSFVVMAQMARMSRAALIGTLDSSYVEMAVLKGARPARIVLRHALPNALGPIVNAVALSLSFLLGGVIIIETIFNYPGLAKLMVDAVSTRDMPVVQACAMIFCAGYLLLTTLADIVAIVSNPRLRYR
ncbi:MAG TPA: ABC transporter permease [Acetobacteraceae bacterium]|nr:ABC transporter permease [Acetobacteraceae bacterium]